ncbi:hypothetical protein IW136_003095, partial [Coemansia sp. RSA 678]
NAMAKAAIAAKPKSTAISAFSVMIHEPTQHVVDDSGKPLRSDQLKPDLVEKSSQQARSASPFMLRDSLYEMIMGRSNSRLSMASINSANSNALSNTSTVGASKEPQQQNAGAQPCSPTSPTSHISPTSTSFEEGNGSPSHTAISSPTDNISFITEPKAPMQVPETVPEVDEPAQLPPRPKFNADDYDDSSSDDSERGSHQNAGFDSGSIGVASVPRPTAASLFAASPNEPLTPVDEPASPVVTDEPASPVIADESELPVLSTPDSAFRAGRIGRRLGRETVEIMQDDNGGSVATSAKFDFIASKDNEPLSPLLEVGALPSDVPLTRDKRDQYLQTLINRNTLRSASPSKRSTHSAMYQAMRSASPGGSDGSDDASRTPSQSASFRQRHASKRSEGAIDFRSPSALGSRERVWDSDSMPRPSSSAAMREALSVSGASINGRMRSNTMNTSSTVLKPTAQARKVSPSLATLKTRNLVSNSPAKSTEPHDASPLGLSPTRQLKLIDSRTRAKSTPADAQPPTLKLPGTDSDVPTLPRGGASSARIGRVAALSQNFERQQQKQSGWGGSRIVIPSRASVLSMASKDSGDLGVVSAPLGNANTLFRRPVARSSSMSSSHSAGGHGQPISASSAQGQQGSTKDEPSQSAQDNDEQPADDDINDGAGGSNSGATGGAGNSGQGDGGDDSSSNGKPSPDPRAALLEPLDSHDSSSSSHASSSSTGRGLAANIRNDSPTVLFGSAGSSDNIGSSIFSSIESRSSSGVEPLAMSEPSNLHAPVSARRETEAERRRRFKELAKRRKSGTLEKISNSGVVKNRQALFVPSEPNMRMPKSSPKHSRVQFVDAQDTENTSFLGRRGAETRPPDSGPDAMPSSLSSVDVDLERLHRANVPTLHPHESPLTRESSVRGGIDADAVLERTLEQAHAEATQSVQDASKVWSHGSDKSKGGSGSNSGRSKNGGSGSGDDSLHILSSFDTNSTPGSTPMDSAQDSMKVGLLAQYDLDQRRVDRRKQKSKREAPPAADTRSDVGDAQVLEFGSNSDDEEHPHDAAFGTMMPSRSRYNPQSLFGLSTVAEVEDESRAPSVVVSEAARSTHEMQERRASGGNLQGLRAALGPHMAVAPIYRGLGSVSIPEANEEPVSPLAAGVTQEALDAALMAAGPASPRAEIDDDTQSHAPSIGSHSFDPYLVFGYTSEDNSTMASRSSLERSDIFNMGRPGSSASRVMYMHPLDTPEPETITNAPVASTSRVTGRRLYDSGVSASMDQPSSEYDSSSSSASYSGKGKAVQRMPEMQQIDPLDSLPHAPGPTVDEIDADASSDEEPINPLLFVESQDFEGYVPIGRQIQQERDERRQERRRKKEAARLGITLPEEEPEEVISPLWFEENPYVDTLPPKLLQLMVNKRDQLMVKKISKHRTTENPDLKRVLDASTISSRRLREELDATMDESVTASRGTIKQLNKRPRTSGISTMFEPPASDDERADNEEPVSSGARRRSKRDQRRSFLDSVEIPVSELSSDTSSEDADSIRGPIDPMLLPLISQEFQANDERYRPPEYDPALVSGTPRKRLVLRTQPKTFSQRVLHEVDELQVTVRDDVHGSVRVRSAGQFAFEPAAGTVRPATMPQYVSALDGVPAGPFFMPPRAAAKAG